MRIIVACPTCSRQYDALGRPMGSVFHCHCGEVLTVQQAAGHDASVIRCSACGGARAPGQRACGYCQASFTIHDRDLHTICPSCMARISDKARFCHSCGSGITPEHSQGALTVRPCPVCGDEARLSHRALGEQAIPLLECTRCAGMWMGRSAFRALEQEAASEGRTFGAPPRAGAAEGNHSPLRQPGPMYRKCPECGGVMNRQNYGRISGVIIDACKDHGVWFDAHELDAILRWVKAGGLEAAAAREQQRRAEELRRLSAQAKGDAAAAGLTQRTAHLSGAGWAGGSTATLGEALLDAALGALRSLFD